VRRIEAITGPVAVELLRHHDRVLSEAAALLRTTPENVPATVADREAKRRQLERSRRSGAAEVTVSADDAIDVDGVRVLVAQAEFEDPKAMPDAADKLRGRLGDPSVIVLGSPGEGRVSLLVAATPGAVERGVKAGEIVKAAARVVGGGGGGRDTMAQAGGRDPDKLPDALAAARNELRRILGA
jgi:alanyl-tRNA synthetase